MYYIVKFILFLSCNLLYSILRLKNFFGESIAQEEKY